MTTLLPTEAEAAALEAIADLTPELDAKRQKFLALHELKAELDAEMRGIRDELGAYLVENGLQGLSQGANVVVRYSTVTTNSLDAKKIRETNPQLWADLIATGYLKTTVSERVTIK